MSDDKDWFRPSTMSNIEKEVRDQMKAHQMAHQYYVQFKRQFEQRKINEYIVISRDTVIGLEDDIAESIKGKFQPYGSLCTYFDSNGNGYRYVQAMVKYED
jgi:hypothetical protein